MMTYRSLTSGRYAGMPSCVGKMPLGIAVAQLTSLACDIDPDEFEELATGGEPTLGPTFRWVLDQFQTGEVMVWSRRLGGGLPQHVPVGYWQIDDPTARFVSSQLSIASPFDQHATPDSWLFIDEEDYVHIWNSVVTAIERQDEVRTSLPRLSTKAASVPKHNGPVEFAADDRMLSLGEVIEKVRLSRGAIYGRIAEKRFPAPIKLGRSSRWLQSELDQWIAQFRSP